MLFILLLGGCNHRVSGADLIASATWGIERTPPPPCPDRLFDSSISLPIVHVTPAPPRAPWVLLVLPQATGSGSRSGSEPGSREGSSSSCGNPSVSVTVTEVPESYTDSFVDEQVGLAL